MYNLVSYHEILEIRLINGSQVVMSLADLLFVEKKIVQQETTWSDRNLNVRVLNPTEVSYNLIPAPMME